jgi:hypothetical protein
MPSKSEKQRKALFAKKGEKWVKEHGFDKVDKGGGSHRKKSKKS